MCIEAQISPITGMFSTAHHKILCCFSKRKVENNIRHVRTKKENTQADFLKDRPRLFLDLWIRKRTQSKLFVPAAEKRIQPRNHLMLKFD